MAALLGRQSLVAALESQFHPHGSRLGKSSSTSTVIWLNTWCRCMRISPPSMPILLDDFDDKANELGIKGAGELGVCGTGAAVASAVFNAIGVRVRDFPITMDQLLPGLPADIRG